MLGTFQALAESSFNVLTSVMNSVLGKQNSRHNSRNLRHKKPLSFKFTPGIRQSPQLWRTCYCNHNMSKIHCTKTSRKSKGSLNCTRTLHLLVAMMKVATPTPLSITLINPRKMLALEGTTHCQCAILWSFQNFYLLPSHPPYLRFPHLQFHDL